MTYDLRYISPSKLARIMAFVIGGLTLIFSLLAFPMLLLAPFPEDDPAQPSKGLFLILWIVYPFFGALWGWFVGQISARVYNFAAKRIGGVTIELIPSEAARQEAA